MGEWTRKWGGTRVKSRVRTCRMSPSTRKAAIPASFELSTSFSSFCKRDVFCMRPSDTREQTIREARTAKTRGMRANANIFDGRWAATTAAVCASGAHHCCGCSSVPSFSSPCRSKRTSSARRSRMRSHLWRARGQRSNLYGDFKDYIFAARV